MNGTLVACMGGFCGARDGCAHYHASSWRGLPAERLCERGYDNPEPIREQAREHSQASGDAALRLQKDRQRLASDPRFAGWASLLAEDGA